MTAEKAAKTASVPDTGIVDAHHHLWDLKRFPYPWLKPDAPPRPFGDHSSIKRDYLPDDYRYDTDGLRIVASVHVEAASGAADPGGESAWLEEMRISHGVPSASIAHADPAASALARDLDAICRSPGVRGVRAGIAWRADSRWKFAAGPAVTRTPEFRSGVAEIARRGLLLELVLLPEQLPEIAEIADAFPDLTIVANHLATLQIDIPGMTEIWRRGILQAAGCRNICIKISGLWSIARDWDPDLLRSPIRFVVDAFGPERCMWGSNLPVERQMCGAARQIGVLEAILGDRRGATSRAVLGDTARRIYRIGEAA
jgi:predicted TIM-barrel fold metal-dependent hydrolase